MDQLIQKLYMHLGKLYIDLFEAQNTIQFLQKTLADKDTQIKELSNVTAGINSSPSAE